MYLSNYECFNCPNECLTCLNENQCQSCKVEYVLKDNKCIHYTQVEHCKSASNSQCQQCEEEYELNDNKNECNKPLNIGLIIGIPSAFVVIIILIIIIIIVLIILKIQRQKEKEKMENICIFKMSKTNIKFIEINEMIKSNKQIIKFHSQNENNYDNENNQNEEIPVNEETKEIICLGNISKNRIKIQITSKSGNNKYEIRTNPQIISLRKGEACEFEIFVKPLCTCLINDEIMIIAIDIKKVIEISIPLKIEIITKISSILDPDDIIE